jgi:hypothetical protein
VIIIHHLVQKLLPCLLSKCRVSGNLFDTGIILLPDHVICLFVNWLVSWLVGCLVGWSVGRSVSQLVYRRECRLYVYIVEYTWG